ncbi:MAG: Druantia anti-phage system protein DruA, partial [Bacteroidota bacterium]
TILPTQPFGYNYNGGKLIALLAASDVAENLWNASYPNRLIGVTTTSLYGSGSMYDSLTYWKKLGHSSGSVKFEPGKDTFYLIKRFLLQEYPRKYWEWFVATEPGGMPLKRDNKNRALEFIYKKFNIDKELYTANHQRGIYFCHLYDNFKEFLRKEIGEDKLVRRNNFDNSVEALTNHWKEKYAYKRIDSLFNIAVKSSDNSTEVLPENSNGQSTDNSSEEKVEKSRLNYPKLFYDDLIKLSWEETKQKYLDSSGR